MQHGGKSCRVKEWDKALAKAGALLFSEADAPNVVKRLGQTLGSD